MYQYSYLVEQVEVLLSQFEWNSRDSPTETRLTDRYRSTDSLSFVTPANFPRAVTVRRMANDVTYTMYAALPIHLLVQSMPARSVHVGFMYVTSSFIIKPRPHLQITNPQIFAQVQELSQQSYVDRTTKERGGEREIDL